MTPDQAVQEAAKGELRPVYVVVGGENVLVRKVVEALREAVLAGGPAGFNDDRFIAPEAEADAVVSAAAMLPMMAKRRWVQVDRERR